jgi:hypothetical protein
MYLNAFCPISDQRVNTAVIRTHALINVLILAILLIFPSALLALFLFTDFLVRVIKFPKLSIVGILARWIVQRFRLKGVQENAGPKLFAARIGLLFAFAITVLLITGNTSASLVVAGILTFFSLLEGVFGFCVACLIYPYVYKLLYRAENGIGESYLKWEKK